MNFDTWQRHVFNQQNTIKSETTLLAIHEQNFKSLKGMAKHFEKNKIMNATQLTKVKQNIKDTKAMIKTSKNNIKKAQKALKVLLKITPE